MKKKITAIALCVALATIAIVGASLAYFTDTDSEDNVFTVGNVSIDLIEEQRTYNRKDVEDFKDKALVPIVGSVQGDGLDSFGMPNAENYGDKMITVKNTSTTNKAYARVIIAFPADLDNPINLGDSTLNVLHWNTGTCQTFGTQWRETAGMFWDWNYTAPTTVTIDGAEYVVHTAYYKAALAPGFRTQRAVNGVYLDKGIDYDSDNEVWTLTYTNDASETKTTDLTCDLSKPINIRVFAQAVQIEGFDDVYEAFDKAGLPSNPWA